MRKEQQKENGKEIISFIKRERNFDVKLETCVSFDESIDKKY
jgi:hypothetical protein